MKMVFIAGHEFLSDQKNGGRQVAMRNYQLWKKAIGEENIYVVIFSNKQFNTSVKNVVYFKTHKNRIEQMKNAIFKRNGYNKAVEAEIKRYIRELNPDVVYFDHSFVGRIIKDINFDSKTKVITFMHNVEKDYVWNKVIHENFLYFIPYLSYWKNEKYIVDRSNAIISISNRDANRVKELYDRKSDLILPVTYNDEFDERRCNEEKSNDSFKLLFVGSLFGPNVQGLKWFIKNIMPELTDVELIVVGFKLETIEDQLKGQNINIVGTVESINEYYYDADAVVLPIFYGGGIKTKTAQAMMFGKTIVASSEALEGYSYKESCNIYKCDKKEEYISCINNLKQNNKKYNEDVRNIYLRDFCTEKKQEEFTQFVEKLLQQV